MMEEKESETCRLYNFMMHCVVIGCLAILGSIGNMISFVVFCKDNIHTSTSFLLQALAIIDTIFLIIVFFTYSVTTFLQMYGRIESQLNMMIYTVPWAFVFHTAALWLVVLIARNRYIAVCQPFKAVKLCTVVRAKKQLVAVLFFSFVYNIPKFLEGEFNIQSPEYEIIYTNVMYTICMLALPLLILIYINSQLIRTLRKLRKKRSEMHSRQTLRHQQDNNVTVVLIVVVVALIICQTPAFINHLIITATPFTENDCPKFMYFLRRASNVMVVINSAINFPIYLIFNKRFREIFLHLLSCLCPAYLRAGTLENLSTEGVRLEERLTNLPHSTVLAPLHSRTERNNESVGNKINGGVKSGCFMKNIFSKIDEVTVENANSLQPSGAHSNSINSDAKHSDHGCSSDGGICGNDGDNDDEANGETNNFNNGYNTENNGDDNGDEKSDVNNEVDDNDDDNNNNHNNNTDKNIADIGTDDNFIQ